MTLTQQDPAPEPDVLAGGAYVDARAAGAVDAAREASIDAYHVLDGRERRDLTGLVALAARACGVPMATLNLITATRQHQVCAVGFEGSVSERRDSMCDVVLDEPEPVVLADASLDDRYCENPWVTGPAHVRFYATHQLITPDDVPIGTLCVFDSSPRVIDDEQRTLLAGLAGRVMDVLELELRSRQLADALLDARAAKAELERSNAQLAVFAGQVSHDLRSPLAGVLLSLESMQDRLEVPGADAGLPPLLDRAVRAAMRMHVLIDNVLGYAGVGGELACQPVDLGELVGGVLADLGAALGGAEVTVAPLPTLVGDPVQLRVLVQNLVANAAKFVAAGEVPRIEIAAEPSPAGWRLTVSDHGLGVDPAERERVFEPLARAQASYPGSGIGLATCRRVARAHGGDIGIEETPGGGATVWVELPGNAHLG